MQGGNKRGLDAGWPSQGLRVKRAILAGRRAGPSTPVPSWKVFNTQLYDGIAAAAAAHAAAGRPTPVSARKLAASLWELQDLPLPASLCSQRWSSSVKAISDMSATPRSHQADRFYTSPKSCKLGANQKLTKASPKGRRNGHRDRQTAAMQSHMHRLLDKRLDSGSPSGAGNGGASYMLESQRQLSTTMACDKNTCPGETNCVTTSNELLKVLNRIRNLEEQHNSSTAMASMLRVELDHARSRVQELELAQKSARKEIDSLLKGLVDERTSWRSQEQEKIRTAVQDIREELEEERKARRRMEVVNRKISRELVDANLAVAKAVQELERERKARELMEDVCDELAREIGEDKAEVEELKRASYKVREEVEEERQMLQLAEVWREERVQMKLAEARLSLEEKSAALDALRAELEKFLRGDRAADEGAVVQEAKVLRHVVDTMHASGMASYPPPDLDGADSLDSDLYTVELDRVDSHYWAEPFELKQGAGAWSHERGDTRKADADDRSYAFASSPEEALPSSPSHCNVTERKFYNQADSVTETHLSEKQVEKQVDVKEEQCLRNSGSEEGKRKHKEFSVGSVPERILEEGCLQIEEGAESRREREAGKIDWRVDATEDTCTNTLPEKGHSMGMHELGSFQAQPQIDSGSVPQQGSWSLTGSENPHITRGIKAYVERPKGTVDVGMKAKLYEAKLERHQARLKGWPL